VHWADPSTLELLDLVIERAQRLPILVLITFRPEFSPPWTGHAHVTQLSLSRLTRQHGKALVARVSGGKALPGDVLDQILARTDGVPLFVEELTKTMLESGLLVDAGDRYALRGPLPALAIPATLQDSLMARLDRLAPVKEVAQTAAAIGREFSHELLAAVSSLPEKQLSAALDQLVDSGLVFRRGTPPKATYSFKHSLVQDAAYQSLLKSKRLQLHTQIGKALEERWPERVDNQPEVLAHHFSEGGLAREAIGYWLKAGQRATRHSANTEAITHLSKGLDLVGNLPAEAERAACELELLIALGPALIAAKGQAAPEVEATYAKARGLCVEVDDRPRLFAAVRGLYIFHLVRGQLGTAIELGQKLLELAELSRDPGDMVEAHRALCATWMYVGQHGRALSEGQRGLALYDPSAHGSHAYRYGVDPGVALGIYTAWTSWFLGYPTAALEGAEAACTRALASGHPYTLAQALVFACYVHQSRRDPERTIERAQSALTVTGEQGFPVWAALMTMLRGWSLAELGDGRGGLGELRRGLAAYRSTGAEVAETYLLSLLAEAEGAVGHSDQALATVDQALQLAGTTGVRCWEPELHRLKGQLHLQRQRANRRAAEESFCKAIEVAQEQDAKSWQLRAATSLARLWAEQRKRAQARDLLAPVYGWFTEGFDTADLKKAKALLDELA
jgi:predicted ATPase